MSVSDILEQFAIEQKRLTPRISTDQCLAQLKALLLSVVQETKDDPEIYWGNGEKIILERLERIFK